MKAQNDKLADRSFFVSVMAKGLGGVIEFTVGITLIFISVPTLQHITEPLARIGLDVAGEVTPGTKLFAIFYATSRGIVRTGLAIALLREILWAYPVALVFLGATAIFQIWLLTRSFHGGLVALTILDVIIMVLTWYEYRKLRRGGHLRPDFI